jgi:hypothetical protein
MDGVEDVLFFDSVLCVYEVTDHDVQGDQEQITLMHALDDGTQLRGEVLQRLELELQDCLHHREGDVTLRWNTCSYYIRFFITSTSAE